jgi:hypothetical protein
MIKKNVMQNIKKPPTNYWCYTCDKWAEYILTSKVGVSRGEPVFVIFNANCKECGATVWATRVSIRDFPYMSVLKIKAEIARHRVGSQTSSKRLPSGRGTCSHHGGVAERYGW